ncbi:MAG: glycosyltransferase family 2 protein [Clostridia bacterium]|nr:glycosyltransferase family 2 protein [Clostridia bacterium]
MNYLDTVRLITNILLFLLGAIMAHFIVFGVVGVFFRKKYPATDKINKYGIVIPARNEEEVVAGLIESIHKNNYPQDQLEIFVIAHNCTDNTAAIARKNGAVVYEYDNPDECTKGYALKYLFEQIEKDCGTQNYDGFFVLDVDNILDRNYISKMNDAFEYYGKQSVITSYRNAKNFGSNILSGLYGMYFIIGCRIESSGRTVLGCSTREMGTGFLFNSKVVKNGWNYVSLTEDWEFSADQICYDNKIHYCDEAVLYDEQPTSLKIMWRQRVRWSRGHLLVFYARFKDLFCKLFKKETKHRMSLYDITAYILPSPLFMMALQLLQFILMVISPLIDKNVTLKTVFFGDSMNFLFSNGLVFTTLRSSLLSFVMMMLMAIVVFITDRKRIKGLSFIRKVLITVLWPVFLFIELPIDIQAFFSRNLGWKPIPHNDRTSFDHVNEKEE